MLRQPNYKMCTNVNENNGIIELYKNKDSITLTIDDFYNDTIGLDLS